ncbi:unnamed protein product [Rotaria sordida]|uniref:G-protein coupled receptors family 1 profile domain-containing protein n=1 Tax=Rotaria sordida TaxID=392033 RepID=A0A819C9T2_9BILA|nr:unnamed protein product [Rotaria sordida]CAF3808999.1 unnamed protein product [Rotaria sordida]
MIAIILNLSGFVLSLFTSIFAIILCLFILVQRRYRQNLEFFIYATTFFAVSLFSLLLFLLNARSLRLDYSIGYDGDSIMCRLHGYFLCVTASATFNGYCLQAASRLIHIVYRQHVWLRTFKVHLLAVIFNWLLACFLMCPYLIFEDLLIYIPSENYCIIPFTNLPGKIYIVLSAFLIQFGFISLVYFRLVVFLHHSVVRNANREFAVVKSIFYTFLIMGTMGILNGIVWVIYLFTNYLYPMSYRLQLLSYSISALIITVAIIILNPRIRCLVFVRKRSIIPLCQLAAIPIRA